MTTEQILREALQGIVDAIAAERYCYCCDEAMMSSARAALALPFIPPHREWRYILEHPNSLDVKIQHRDVPEPGPWRDGA